MAWSRATTLTFWVQSEIAIGACDVFSVTLSDLPAANLLAEPIGPSSTPFQLGPGVSYYFTTALGSEIETRSGPGTWVGLFVAGNCDA